MKPFPQSPIYIYIYIYIYIIKGNVCKSVCDVCQSVCLYHHSGHTCG